MLGPVETKISQRACCTIENEKVAYWCGGTMRVTQGCTRVFCVHYPTELVEDQILLNTSCGCRIWKFGSAESLH